MHPIRRASSICAYVGACAILLIALIASATPSDVPTFSPPVLLDTASSEGSTGLPAGTEPRIARAPDGALWTITNRMNGQPEVFTSVDAATWRRTGFPHIGQPSPDVDIVVTRTGRLVATDLTFTGFSARVFYSDDGGTTWTASKGTALADQDRPWLSAGPDDPKTHQPRVYLLFHNLFSGFSVTDMFVSTSRDGGATFGPPVPLVLPGDPAFEDLACGGSSGPSGIAVDQASGRIYAAWGTRTSPRLGTCGDSLPPGTIGFSVEPSTRIWVATSQDGSVGSWRTSLAVDESKTKKTLGMLYASVAVDSAGNVYLAYPETPNPWPDYSGAAVKYRWAPPGLPHWSPPVTVAPAGGAGHLTVQVVAGSPGRLGFAYLTGVERVGADPAWFARAARTLDGLTPSPHVFEADLASFPSYTGTANELAGACGSGPIAGMQQGLLCPRATDDFGLTTDALCRLVVVWPAIINEADGDHAGTWASSQTAGDGVCSSGPRDTRRG